MDTGTIGQLIFEVSKAFRRRFEDVARQHELTLPQWRVLSELARQDGLSQVRLANAVDADPMTMSGILDRLEKRRLVERRPDPTDSRAKVVLLTADGRDVFKAAKALATELVDAALTGMSEQELEAVAKGLIRIRDNIGGAAAAQKDIEQ